MYANSNTERECCVHEGSHNSVVIVLTVRLEALDSIPGGCPSIFSLSCFYSDLPPVALPPVSV